MADRHEYPCHWQGPFGPGNGIAQAQPLDVGLADDLGDFAVPYDLDLVVGQDSTDHDLRGTKLLAPMHDCHLGGETSQKQRLFHGRVATADDGDLLLPEEKPVTGCAPRQTVAGQPILLGQTEPAVGRSCRKDDRPSVECLAQTSFDSLDLSSQIKPDSVIKDDARTKSFGLRTHGLHQFWTLDSIDEAREVLHVGRRHQCSSSGD